MKYFLPLLLLGFSSCTKHSDLPLASVTAHVVTIRGEAIANTDFSIAYTSDVNATTATPVKSDSYGNLEFTMVSPQQEVLVTLSETHNPKLMGTFKVQAKVSGALNAGEIVIKE